MQEVSDRMSQIRQGVRVSGSCGKRSSPCPNLQENRKKLLQINSGAHRSVPFVSEGLVLGPCDEI